jgi:hypothetical protein
MFNKYPNFENANSLVNMFEPIFNYSLYTEHYAKCHQNTFVIRYIAENNNWSMVIETFGKRASEKGIKILNPNIYFKHKAVFLRVPQANHMKEIKEYNKIITDYAEKLYQPDYQRVIKFIESFVNTGIDSGMVNSHKTKTYDKGLYNHLNNKNNFGEVRLGVYNISTINFNNLLQEIKNNTQEKFKKSYISIEIEHLVDSNNEVKAYFKIMLPYSENNKLAYVIPMSGEKIAYYVEDIDYLRIKHIDQMEKILINDDNLTKHFKEKFKNEIIESISKSLKIDKAALNEITPEELKAYFVLVEMLKI